MIKLQYFPYLSCYNQFLSSFKGENNWRAVDDSGFEYEINVCNDLLRPIANDPDENCRGAAICQVGLILI